MVCDDNTPTGCDAAIVYINVLPVNDAPVVNDTAVTTAQDSTVTVCLTVTDVDITDNFTVSSCGEPANGMATWTVSGNQICVTYMPNVGFNGLDSLCLLVCDDGNPTACHTAMVYITVTPAPPPGLLIPQGFSPNGDGRNDRFVILGLESYPNNDIQIFNRWGNTVFAAERYQNDWDGRSAKGLRVGSELPVGTYYYTLRLAPDRDLIKGFIYLTR
jgi:gliding motility-associated-like protein